jgi:hypothetical protein
MNKNVVKTSVVPTTTLIDQEKYAVGFDGVKTGATGDFVYGIVSQGRPANEASEIITRGETLAKVNGTVNIAAEDPLTGGANGKLVKATIGTHLIRAIATEAVTSDTESQVILI